MNRKDCEGGLIFCLGGRSAAWGLFTPCIHGEFLRKEYPDDVINNLLWNYCTDSEAEKLINLSKLELKIIH